LILTGAGCQNQLRRVLARVTLYEAAILATRTFKAEPWIENIGPATSLEIEIREPTTKHSITLRQVERWLESTSASPSEMMKRTKLRQLLIPEIACRCARIQRQCPEDLARASRRKELSIKVGGCHAGQVCWRATLFGEIRWGETASTSARVPSEF